MLLLPSIDASAELAYKGRPTNGHVSLADLLDGPGPQEHSVTIEIILATPADSQGLAPSTPTLTVMFSLTPTQSASVKVGILPNAKLEIQYQNIYMSATEAIADQDETTSKDAATESDDKLKAMARALEICGDIGIWVEWIKSRYS